MKSAYFAAEDFALLDRVKAEFLARGGAVAEAVAQVTGPDGYLFNFFACNSYLEVPLDDVVAADVNVEVPDFQNLAFFYIECRSEEYFAEMVGFIAGLAEGRSWVVDSGAVVWNAMSVDPRRVIL